MKTEIIAVGTELLLGDVTNTNAAYLSAEFAKLGFDVYRHATVGDNLGRIRDALGEAFARADLVVTTGGLGPTADDLTKDAAAEFFGLPMELHGDSLAAIEAFFARLGHRMPDSNRRQALFPQGARVLDNPDGTAPGCLLALRGKTFVALPGPPREMRAMFERHVRPHFLPEAKTVLVSRAMRFAGIGESAMEALVKDIIVRQENPTIAPYCTDRAGEVMLRLSAKAPSEALAREMIAPVEKSLAERLGEYLYGYDGDTLPAAVVGLLREKGLTLSAAESFTGGAFSAALVGVPGASEVFMESYVTYSDESKVKLLGVSGASLGHHGAVSKRVAEEMAAGAARRSGAALALGFTGVAGPGGGSEAKPVGLCYISLWRAGGCRTARHMLFGDRDRIRARAVALGLDMARRALLA